MIAVIGPAMVCAVMHQASALPPLHLMSDAVVVRAAEISGNGGLERNESEIGATTARLERTERNPGTLRERRFAV